MSGDNIDRRVAINLGAAALGLASYIPRARALGTDQAIPLWPAGHSANGADPAKAPALMVYRPAKPNGAAIIVPPGGAYAAEAMAGDGDQTAKLFSARGITMFVLQYRLPGGHPDVPHQDAQRAMRLVRSNAAAYRINPARIGMMGFSSGGHMAAMMATRFSVKTYDPVDQADQTDPRPDFVAMLYPVITMGQGAHDWSRVNLMGRPQTSSQQQTYSAEKNVKSNSPPCFICCGADDAMVDPTANSMAMFLALRAAKIPAELHIFEQGAHGFGVGIGKYVSPWPDLFMRWGALHGFFPG